MTSGNLSGEPLCLTDQDAVARLSGVADAFLAMTGRSPFPCEDSVLAWHRESARPGRRSRSDARVGSPRCPVALSGAAGESRCCGRGRAEEHVRAGPRRAGVRLRPPRRPRHSGEPQRAFEAATAQMLRFHRGHARARRGRPAPGLRVARLGRPSSPADLGVPAARRPAPPRPPGLALAAEHGRLDGARCLGVVFDGTGYGCDATVWGGEFLCSPTAGWQRNGSAPRARSGCPAGTPACGTRSGQAALAMLARAG